LLKKPTFCPQITQISQIKNNPMCWKRILSKPAPKTCEFGVLRRIAAILEKLATEIELTH
jgi:hypothetical protein